MTPCVSHSTICVSDTLMEKIAERKEAVWCRFACVNGVRGGRGCVGQTTTARGAVVKKKLDNGYNQML